jgi:hypothetical protein
MTGPDMTGTDVTGTDAASTDEGIDFFVSYTRSDEGWAIWTAHKLELAGYRVLIQAWDFGTGNFLAHMEEAVQRSEWLLPIYTSAYRESKYGRDEWTAYQRDDPAKIIPIQVEEVNARSMLATLVRIRLTGLGEQEAEKKLLAEIRKHVTPKHSPRDRMDGQGVSFPVIAHGLAEDAESTQETAEAPRPPVVIDRDHIQLILLGDGEAAGQAVGSFLGFLDAGRCLDLFGSGLSADEQLGQVAELVQSLDPEDVSDVLVIFAGQGGTSPDAGVHLDVRVTDPGQPASTSISLPKLLERLQYGRDRLRGYLILDAVNPQGQPVSPSGPAAVPVLTVGRGDHGGRGLAAISEALAGLAEEPPYPAQEPPDPAAEPADKPRHWGPLCLADLRALGGGELLARKDSPAYLIGLVRSPLAWPPAGRAKGSLAHWCAVISESDGRRPEADSVGRVVRRLAETSLYRLNRAYSRCRPPIELEKRPHELLAGKVLSSPGTFARAIEQVCRADLAIFDLTSFEPAVMILLGIRAVIRRGLTVCLAGEHDPPWLGAEPPFHLREVSLVTPPSRDALLARIQEGIRQLDQSGDRYCDLPCFDLIRAVPPDPEQRQARAFDARRNPSILALVPFDPDYVKRNWKQIEEDLPEKAWDTTTNLHPEMDEVQRPKLARTLDLDSPRVVSAQLFEAIRLTDFCLVDLTGARPNVLFELGVRLAANRLHPVVVEDQTYRQDVYGTADHSAEAGWLKNVNGQLEKLRLLLQPVEYAPGREGVFTQMVERHLEFRRLLHKPEDLQAQSLPDRLPPAGIYDLAWPHAVAGHEVVTMPVPERLQSGGEELLVDQTMGLRHLIYPTKHYLTDAAERTGLEYLVAAWLYLHFREQAGGNTDTALAGRYDELTDNLIIRLLQTGKPSDAAFARRLGEWQAEGDGGQQTGGQE